eukprot:TRINITY_DN15938_c0_g1_i1.p2 TRINITY_DN15938_c0_g1~~TRINITY_DN15938_c0_g1_i1.p2  ORF type:complete len:183 (-),score=49.20 TRINITY_DN15938_c0_g1_i1:342-890(-)
MLAEGGTSMESNRAEELQSTLKKATVAAAASGVQQDLPTRFAYLGEHQQTLFEDALKVLNHFISYVEEDVAAAMEESQMSAKLSEVDALCRDPSSGGVVAQPLTAPEALVSRETTAAKAREREQLKSILAKALDENRALSAQLEQKKAEAAELADGIATIGDEYKEVQERDARWKSRKLLTT